MTQPIALPFSVRLIALLCSLTVLAASIYAIDVIATSDLPLAKKLFTGSCAALVLCVGAFFSFHFLVSDRLPILRSSE